MVRGDDPPSRESAGQADSDDLSEAAIVARHGPGLRVILLQWTKDPALAEDLYQEAFCVLFERLKKSPLEDPANCGGYLYRTARNLFVDEVRMQSRRANSDVVQHIDSTETDANKVLDNAVQLERRRIVSQVISELKVARDRKILVMFYIDDCTKEEVCSKIGVGLSHFKRVLHRARQRYKALLDEKGLSIEL